MKTKINITKELIEQKISEFSGINFKLGKAVISKNKRCNTYILDNINIKNIQERYIFDSETFELLKQVN